MLHHFQGLLSDFLSEYRKFCSFNTTLLRLVEDRKECLDRGELVTVGAMDLSKAFDRLPRALLIAKLRAYGLDEQGCSFFEGYLQDRQPAESLGWRCVFNMGVSYRLGLELFIRRCKNVELPGYVRAWH